MYVVLATNICSWQFKMAIIIVIITIKYWVVQKVRAAKDFNLINEIKNLNLLRFNFPSKSA